MHLRRSWYYPAPTRAQWFLRKALGLFEVFLTRRCFSINAGGTTKSFRDAKRGVPQDSILAPSPSNILVSTLLKHLPSSESHFVRLAIYAAIIAGHI